MAETTPPNAPPGSEKSPQQGHDRTQEAEQKLSKEKQPDRYYSQDPEQVLDEIEKLGLNSAFELEAYWNSEEGKRILAEQIEQFIEAEDLREERQLEDQENELRQGRLKAFLLAFLIGRAEANELQSRSEEEAEKKLLDKHKSSAPPAEDESFQRPPEEELVKAQQERLILEQRQTYLAYKESWLEEKFELFRTATDLPPIEEGMDLQTHIDAVLDEINSAADQQTALIERSEAPDSRYFTSQQMARYLKLQALEEQKAIHNDSHYYADSEGKVLDKSQRHHAHFVLSRDQKIVPDPQNNNQFLLLAREQDLDDIRNNPEKRDIARQSFMSLRPQMTPVSRAVKEYQEAEKAYLYKEKQNNSQDLVSNRQRVQAALSNILAFNRLHAVRLPGLTPPTGGTAVSPAQTGLFGKQQTSEQHESKADPKAYNSTGPTPFKTRPTPNPSKK